RRNLRHLDKRGETADRQGDRAVDQTDAGCAMRAVQDDNQPDRHEEAALWCMSLAEGQLPPGEREAFDRWLGDDRNAAAFQAVVRTWKTADGAGRLPEAIGMRSAALESYRNVNRRRWTRRLGPRSYWGGGIAAALVLTVTTL